MRRLVAAMGAALLVACCLPAPRGHGAALAQWSTLARITAYTQSGTTASGEPTIDGYTAACSADIPLWSTIVLPDGATRVCTDRGQLGDGSAYSWVDLYTAGDWQWIPATYGDWITVEVVE